MRPAKLGVLLLLAVVVVAWPPDAFAAGRVALVVGNSTYAHIGRLPNPGNDAADMTAALGRLGFDVTTVRDADRNALTDALRVFTRESTGADVSLVFYAGHGLEMDGVNYLVPVDARLERDTDVRFEAIELDDVLASTVGADLRVVILDPCRNTPLACAMQRTGAARSVSRGSFGNLDEGLLGDETLVAY
ncbi:MAG: caspase family protein, partial [Acidobacteria bacterium]|nr:caspase family protein [Acidobacteriota bacterium]